MNPEPCERIQNINGCKCVFFDRDGIVNKAPYPEPYITRWEDFHIISAFVDSLRVVLQNGYHAVITSNQRAVAKGLLSIEQIDEMHRKLQDILNREYRLQLLDIVYCPHNPDECSCRKPQPGMLLAMARKHGIDLPVSWMVGDQETDVEAGRLAGCHTIIVSPTAVHSNAEIKISSMDELPPVLKNVLSKDSDEVYRK